MEKFLTEDFWLVQTTIFTIFITIISMNIFIKKSYTSVLSIAFSYFFISAAILPEQSMCMNRTNLDGSFTELCFHYQKNKVMYILYFLCFYLQKIFIITPQGDFEKFNFKLNNPFINRQVTQKNLLIYLFLTIPLIPLSYFLSKDLHNFVQVQFLSSGLSTKVLFKLILQHKFDLTFYINYFTQIKDTVPLNFAEALMNPKAIFYWFTTVCLNFPGMYVLICDISSIFTLFPISLITTSQKVIARRGLKKLYIFENDYYYVHPNIALEKQYRELTSEELKLLAEISTFSLQRGIYRILNRE
ncbi:Transmembrane domain-containing protein [Spironucleus salmonicida]|uniref:Transmembrane domain-containing protein n=1 Tax=Spironucleus salmonicida TaxID=348837 RepID=V6LSL0_9EUKA|nr:Transmembrane domain-containing protein [Spironucleus salmonicida]|eukprot:EST46661.1 Transmembrane domain-containing protein [Spironucleus salmonicida]